MPKSPQLMKTLLWVLLLTLTIGQANAQTFSILSIQGETVPIKLYHPPAIEKLLIISSKDTITLNNFWSLDTATVQSKVFLKIVYAVRVGSNNGSENQLWLLVDSGRVKQALHIKSFLESDYGPDDYSCLTVNTTLVRKNPTNYQLMLNLKSGKQKSGKRVFDVSKMSRLNFTLKSGYFYNSFTLLKGKYSLKPVNHKTSKQRFLNQKVPTVKILDDKYYFIKGNWYSKYKGIFYAMAEI